MVMPANAEEASEVIKIIAKNECPFGIRGGGHGADAYSNGIDEGVTIDLGKPTDCHHTPLISRALVVVCTSTYSPADLANP